MGRKRHTPEQIITALREAEVGLARGKSVKLISRELGITEQTYYRWRREYGGMKVSQARRLVSFQGVRSLRKNSGSTRLSNRSSSPRNLEHLPRRPGGFTPYSRDIILHQAMFLSPGAIPGSAGYLSAERYVASLFTHPLILAQFGAARCKFQSGRCESGILGCARLRPSRPHYGLDVRKSSEMGHGDRLPTLR